MELPCDGRPKEGSEIRGGKKKILRFHGRHRVCGISQVDRTLAKRSRGTVWSLTRGEGGRRGSKPSVFYGVKDKTP